MHKLYKGERNPKLKTLRLIARGYGVSLTEIVSMLEDSLLAEGVRAPAPAK